MAINSILFLNLRKNQQNTTLSEVEHVFGVEQIASDEAVIFYLHEGKNVAASIDIESGEILEKYPLSGI